MTGADGPNATRASLLLRLRDPNDEESWQAFVDIYGPLIQRYAMLHGLQEADAADVKQDVLIQVTRSIRDFEYDRERGRFRDWLGTIVRHRVHRFMKRMAGKAQGVGEDWLDDLPASEQESQWTETFNMHVLKAALDRVKTCFEPKTWEAFRLTWLEQQPAQAAAGQLNIPIAHVYLAKSRVLDRLRHEVALLAEDFPLEPR